MSSDGRGWCDIRNSKGHTLLTGYDDLIKESKTMDIDFVKPLSSFLEKFSPAKWCLFHLYTKVAQNYHLAIEERQKIELIKHTQFLCEKDYFGY